MSLEVTGVVLRQVKTTGARRMVGLFTREQGKLDAGAYASEGGKSKSALATRPFTLGRYFITEKAGGFRTISSAETLDAHFALGEDADRFAEASFALEFIDKILPENFKSEGIFDLLLEHFALLCVRKENFRLPTLFFMVKLMQEAGVFPEPAELASELRAETEGAIIDCAVFLAKEPYKRAEVLTLDGEIADAAFALLLRFAKERFGLGTLKTERLLGGSAKEVCSGNNS